MTGGVTYVVELHYRIHDYLFIYLFISQLVISGLPPLDLVKVGMVGADV